MKNCMNQKNNCVIQRECNVNETTKNRKTKQMNEQTLNYLFKAIVIIQMWWKKNKNQQQFVKSL